MPATRGPVRGNPNRVPWIGPTQPAGHRQKETTSPTESASGSQSGVPIALSHEGVGWWKLGEISEWSGSERRAIPDDTSATAPDD